MYAVCGERVNVSTAYEDSCDCDVNVRTDEGLVFYDWAMTERCTEWRVGSVRSV